jgi:hypothetical protein
MLNERYKYRKVNIFVTAGLIEAVWGSGNWSNLKLYWNTRERNGEKQYCSSLFLLLGYLFLIILYNKYETY